MASRSSGVIDNLDGFSVDNNPYTNKSTKPKLSFIDFFPDCVLPDCSNRSTPHSHILPHQQTILDCNTKYLYCQGGVGSAKSLAFAVKSVWLSLTTPNNKGVVSRLHYDDLFDSSWLEIKNCLNRLVEKNIIPEPQYSKKVQGDYTQINLFNGSQIKAVQGKNWQRGLGANHGWFWVDDAMESQEEFFIGTNTSAGLLSRLRLPHVHFDKNTYHSETRPHGALHGMVSSNPPPYGHWLHKLFGDKVGTYTIGGDSVTWLMTATSDNPFVGADYAKGLIAVQHKMGNNENTTRRVIFGESIKAYKGVPVYPQFNRATHVAPVKFRSDLPLIRSWDFGFDHPVVLFSNVYKCNANNNHYFTLSEVAHAYNLTIYRFYDEYVLPHTKALYSNAKLIRDCGDRAGFRPSSSNKDGRSDMKILIVEYHLSFRYKYSNITPSLQYMRGLLEPREPCKCGLPYILINNKCPTLIDALDGGYHYAKTRGKPIADKPTKDKTFDDVADAWRYGAENYVKWGVSHEDQQNLRDTVNISSFTRSSDKPQTLENNTLSWLNDVDRAFMKQFNAVTP